jgi:hypothetical protein
MSKKSQRSDAIRLAVGLYCDDPFEADAMAEALESGQRPVFCFPIDGVAHFRDEHGVVRPVEFAETP